MFFLFQTTFRGSFAAKADAAVRLPLPVEGFLLADPFVGAMTLLSTHTVYRGLLWSVGPARAHARRRARLLRLDLPVRHAPPLLRVAPPVAEGARVAPRRREQDAHLPAREVLPALRLPRRRPSSGSAIGGLFDPICIAVRSIGLGVIPARAVPHPPRRSAPRSDHGSRAVQGAADHAQDFLARTVWQRKQFYFHQTWLIVFLFVAVLFANRFIPRFWCRVLCPLGAFLGVFSRFALFGMEKDHAKCTDCNLCLVHCQGADSPAGRASSGGRTSATCA